MRRRNIPCLVCGVIVYTDGSHCVAHQPKPRFASGRPSARERDARGRYKWKKIRLRVLRRAKFKCESCGVNAELQVHHVVHLSDGGSNDMSNLVAVCVKCHQKEHVTGR